VRQEKKEERGKKRPSLLITQETATRRRGEDKAPATQLSFIYKGKKGGDDPDQPTAAQGRFFACTEAR